MKPHPEYKDDADWLNSGRTVGLIPVERPHNEKHDGVFQTRYLREAVDIAEVHGFECLYLWTLDGPGDARSLGFTPTLESKMAIIVCGLAGEIDG